MIFYLLMRKVLQIVADVFLGERGMMVFIWLWLKVLIVIVVLVYFSLWWRIEEFVIIIKEVAITIYFPAAM